MYHNGQGIEQNDAEAVRWYRKAAEQGHARAQFNVGVMYHNGKGVEKDDSATAYWHRKAAEQDVVMAQYNMGFMYENGVGVEQSYSEAARWYLSAAEQGDARAQSNLGVMYEEGQGVEHSMTQAAKWYRKAAAQGHALAQYNLGRVVAEGCKQKKELARRKVRKGASGSLILLFVAIVASWNGWHQMGFTCTVAAVVPLIASKLSKFSELVTATSTATAVLAQPEDQCAASPASRPTSPRPVRSPRRDRASPAAS
eukprot:gnl/TRDRNA2_/TRDRNA2_157720_c0_seq2.p1 gnl/TRDRNA2_/TRDRNA2_157720_c0~~gnl/TRDRNA2_/TRDRNA2_157720_c0_seq2.p1  ORF type:complete len:255 (+),score=46.43 gnl/TRDRNA2_/TRDRNA2_157720_c0_seq2:193-957(+)